MWKKLVAVVFGVVVGYWLIDDFQPARVRGKRVLITGASTGIGEQMAYHYARLGANIVITSRRENRLKEVIAKCRELGGEDQTYNYVVADMADLNSTQHVIQETVRILGGLDNLVLNHIILLKLGPWIGSQHNISLIDTVMKVNFQSYVLLASHGLPYLEKSGGSIVVVSSLAGKLGQPFLPIYSASKFALEGFFSGLRQEFKIKDCDISITMCFIGFIGTQNSVNQLMEFGQDWMIKNVKPASPSDTALAIIKGGASRQENIYYPYMQVRPMIIMNAWLPNAADFFIRNVYSFNSL